MSNRLLKVSEVAQKLNLKPSTIYRWVNTGYLPYMALKLGKRKNVIRFSEKAVENWIEEKERETKRFDRTSKQDNDKKEGR